MEPLTIAKFVPFLAGYSAPLAPQDASRLTLAITELMVDHSVDPPLLKLLLRFLTPLSYDEITEERNIEHLCGHLVCAQLPTKLVRRLSANSNGTTTAAGDPSATQFQIYRRKPAMILPNTFLSQYCCKEHYQASLFYRKQLSDEAVFARENILLVPPFSPDAPPQWYERGITLLEEVLQKHDELKHEGKSLTDVITMMNAMNLGTSEGTDTSNLIRLLEDFDIVEKDGGLDGDSAIVDEDESDHETATNPSSIEGYVTSNKSFGGYVV